jgi:sensor histidine kinase YesM
VLEDLAELFRGVLADEHESVSLTQEIELARKYLAIEQIRFGDRLQVTFAVDSDTVELPVPSLILQPLVENAIHHGVSQRAAAGSVEIRARRIGGMLEIVVYDSGSAAPRARPEERVEGVGLGNTRARLTHLYGDRFSLQLRETVDGGTIAEMMLPIGDAGAEARAAG